MFQSSLSRPLLISDGLDPNNHAATQPELNLVLPADDKVISGSPPTKKNFASSDQNVVACDYLMNSKKNLDMESKGELKKQLERKYGPLILNSLPKGVPIPPSGPSKRINSMGMN
ncbi:hypothetical protein LguiA_023854 [Lonicera macranthoides]